MLAFWHGNSACATGLAERNDVFGRGSTALRVPVGHQRDVLARELNWFETEMPPK
jgi:hypothetical protein